MSAEDIPAETSPAVTDTVPSPEVNAALDHLEPFWESMKTDVVSAEVRLRMFFQIRPPSPLTRESLREILHRYDLGEHPERVAEFLREVGGPDAKVDVPVRYHAHQGHLRRDDVGQLAYYQDEEYGFIHDQDNKQIHVYERGRVPYGSPGLELFRFPLQSRIAGYHPDRAERDGDTVKLTTKSVPAGQAKELITTNTVDWATGVTRHRLRVLGGEIFQEMDYLGLTTLAGGITCPRCVVAVRFKEGIPESLDLYVLDEAQLNISIPEATFVVSVPAGWQVLDFRQQAKGNGIAHPADSVDDVRTLIPAYAMNPAVGVSTPPRAAAPISNMKRTLLILNGLALMALGVWLWRRESIQEPKH